MLAKCYICFESHPDLLSTLTTAPSLEVASMTIIYLVIMVSNRLILLLPGCVSQAHHLTSPRFGFLSCKIGCLEN